LKRGRGIGAGFMGLGLMSDAIHCIRHRPLESAMKFLEFLWIAATVWMIFHC
jgi:hypothetical protein